MKKPKYGPSFWSEPATAGVYRYALLPALTLLPLLGLWMQGNWSYGAAALSCFVSYILYICLPVAVMLNRDSFLRDYWRYRDAIEARLHQSDVLSAEECHLRRKLAKLESQYHLVLNPAPTMLIASVLASVVWRLARTLSRH
ncbi:hypothetical protein QMO42_07350 [Pseudomonas aeruginosa]|uniref:hypothetical protein n=1 Tax=Pseudomonas aeruginosa TaxID=287 RepID=UPI0024AFA06D|nr:hypothetical protein [Pseudomonas aeruginosa]MDI7134224.1 hypothetical protein [Pseudomonas aeruginosa]